MCLEVRPAAVPLEALVVVEMAKVKSGLNMLQRGVI